MIKRLFLTFMAIVLIGSGVSFADSGVRPLSLGGAFVGLADDAEAAFWNPAALGMLSRPEINYSCLLHNQDEIGSDHKFGFVYPIQRFQDRDCGVLGFSFIHNINEGLVDYDSALSLKSKLTQNQYLLSYGRKFLVEEFALGVNLHYDTYEAELTEAAGINGANYSLGSSDSDSYLGFDLSGYLRWRKLALGIMLQNLNEPKLNLFGTDINYDLKINPGLAYLMDEKTNYSIELYDSFQSNQIRIGGERWLTPYLALRLGGYNLNKKKNRALTFGCGLNSAGIFAYTDIEIDYALLYWTDNPAGEDDVSHLLGFKMRF